MGTPLPEWRWLKAKGVITLDWLSASTSFPAKIRPIFTNSQRQSRYGQNGQQLTEIKWNAGKGIANRKKCRQPTMQEDLQFWKGSCSACFILKRSGENRQPAMRRLTWFRFISRWRSKTPMRSKSEIRLVNADLERLNICGCRFRPAAAWPPPVSPIPRAWTQKND